MLIFTTSERVLAALRIAVGDPAAVRVVDDVAAANRITFDHIGRADDDPKFAEPGVMELCAIAATTVARELHARPESSFGLIENNEFGPVFMSRDALAGVRSMLATVQPATTGFGV